MGKLEMADKIGIIGFGNMGSVIAYQLSLNSAEYDVSVFEKDRIKVKELKGINFAQSTQDLISKVDSVLLAVKPQDLDSLLKDIKRFIDRKLIITIAAGISTSYIEKVLGEVRVIRAMPNIAAKIGESVTCLCAGKYAEAEDLEFAKEIFYYLGTVSIIEEEMMNAATAISGSGPGYIYYFLESNQFEYNNIPEHAIHDMMKRLEKAALTLGFDLKQASFLAANTVNSSVSLIKDTRLPPEELKAQVASKGGTTEAGLEVLKKGGSWEEAALAALKRAKELSGRC